MKKYVSALSPKLVYIMTIPDEQHTGCVKVGDATVDTDEVKDLFDLQPNSKVLNQAAKKRIDSYTKTASISYRLHHTEMLVYLHKGKIEGIRDYAVRDILLRSGIKKRDFGHANQGREWYCCDIQTAINAIKAAKEGRSALNPDEITTTKQSDIGENVTPYNTSSIIFREEQIRAINRTVTYFSGSGKQMLWNAKMRFGKTLTSLEVARRLNAHRTLILTHRPVVDDEWFSEFAKIFNGTTYRYGSKNKGFKFEELENDAKKDPTKHYIYFASMQDMRGSELVGGNFNKNQEEFNTNWDLLIVDEAHEGTQTELGQSVISLVCKENTKTLSLSGTPFNLLDNYKEGEIFTWDYVMEQRAKADWDKNHFGDPNPYANLPRLNIFTFDLYKLLNMDEYQDIEDKAFNFREFFRVQDDKFIHENDVKRFLDLIVKYDKGSNYPYSNEEYRKIFRHSLWMIPGVQAARCLSELLKKHEIFGKFNIVNVAGDGDDDVPYESAKKMVLDAITDEPESTYTITLSCGRLTTGVTIKPWTAVFMLSGSHTSDAKAYMQTIFRVQSPWEYKGRVKEECYCFDFAPDRTLKVIAETAKISAKAGQTTTEDKKIMDEFLNFCPVIACNGTKMNAYDTNTLLENLKKAYIDRVIRKGFDDVYIYSDKLLKVTGDELMKFNKLKKIIGTTKSMQKTSEIDIAKNGLTDEEYNRKKDLEKKKKQRRPLTPEEEEELRKLKEEKNQRTALISILRGISIRIPLLVYGADIDPTEDITMATLPNIVDDASWEEFMPKGVDKKIYSEFIEYYDEDIIRAAARQIRDTARAADTLPPTERVQRIAMIFSHFHNPDKETILTPWRVVNMHMSDTIGGYDFFNETHSQELFEPRLVVQKDVTKNVLDNENTKVLEINSKTGLYPLYVTYSIYRFAKQSFVDKNMLHRDLTFEEKLKIWDEVVQNNLFVICKTKMARSITKRTLVGFREVAIRAHAYDDLINQVQNNKENLIKRIQLPSFWNLKNTHDMLKFNAVVGNPPYQLTGGSGGNNDAPIFQLFSLLANNITTDYTSLIMPARWYAAGRENLLGDYRNTMLTCGHIQKLKTFSNGTDIFSNVEIKGGICYYLFNKQYNGLCEYTLITKNNEETDNLNLAEFDILIRDPKLAAIVRKIHKQIPNREIITVDTIISNDTPFGIPSNPRTSSKTPFKVYTSNKPEHNILLYHIENQKRKIEYVALNDIRKNIQDIKFPKVFIPGAGGGGNDPYVLGKPEVAPANSVCSQSFLYAAFNTDEEALNFSKYIRSKFLRILVSVMKITQSAPQRAYRFVPIQDFTGNSDINWTLSISEIDQQLYKKYNLSDIDIEYIENTLKLI